MVELPGSLEENIDVDHWTTMPLVSDLLNVLESTWGKWSVSTKFAFKRLTSKKLAAEVQCTPTEVQRDSASRGTAENLSRSVGKPVRRRSAQDKPVTYCLKDVAVHDKPQDCWIVIKEKVCSRWRGTLSHNFGTSLSE